ncbi:fucolectin-like [Hyperolius riggenbachi]|uniref:fucolectin-like n=1 Tax=Hyperolius riggenbachi TaxID=752182 RepID=UPI0035A2CBE2
MVYMMKITMSAVAIFTLLGMLVDAKLTEENVALRGRATMSSKYYGPDSSLTDAMNAIDGNTDTNYYHGSCVSTNGEFSPWWRVDLLESYKISHVVFTARGDCCGDDHMNGAEILIGDSLANNGNDNARCATITSSPQGSTQTFHCAGMKGRYVNIIMRKKHTALYFCEIQIFGVPVNDNVCFDRSY